MNQNSESLTVLVTAVGVLVALAGVLVALYYAILTRRLWQVANQQARITHAIFEASHRPIVTVEAKEPKNPEIQHELSFDIVLRNEGTVPAEITLWDLRANVVGLEQTVWQTREPVEVEVVGRALAPRVPATIPVRLTSAGIHDPVLPLQLQIRVEYLGVGPWIYVTRMTGILTGRAWQSQGYDLLEIRRGTEQGTRRRAAT